MLENKNIVYLIGIGGIGMSALARYFLLKNWMVYGYDAVCSQNAKMLEKLGAIIHYNETTDMIQSITETNSTQSPLIIYTPAIAASSPILQWIKDKKLPIYKRSEVLGHICSSLKTAAVAGTHGKTTISSLIAHILYNSEFSCTAFLGGIVKNYQSNFLYSERNSWVVVEADEYDRSFLQLTPEVSVITSVDADHLDIYKSYQSLKQAYQDYINKIKTGGKLLIKKSLSSLFDTKHLQIATYDLYDKSADSYLKDVSINNGYFVFTVSTPWGEINLQPKITGWYNVENILAACSMALWMGIDARTIKKAVESFEGIQRRFDIIVHNDRHIYIDDYAHHPEEIKALITSIRAVFGDIPITGIFQPHLYSRTRDLANEFAEALSLLDELCLLPIYPARELPISGIDSSLLLNKVSIKNKELIEPSQLLDWIKSRMPKLIVTMGAGNIDRWVEPIKNLLLKNEMAQ
ncbi:MAG: UDP-N-acetylmuramate--L-alanine ligase [Bacteroidales bacterium]|nr:UDP-N-acetylmuramate--L-alanine ligase [Bacteroidales bacterium]